MSVIWAKKDLPTKVLHYKYTVQEMQKHHEKYKKTTEISSRKPSV